jgi:hypothetical protein
VVRKLVGLPFRRHHVAGLAAELHRLHVLDGAVGELGADQHVDQGGRAEEDRQPAQGRRAVDDRDREPLADPPPGQDDAQRDTGEAGEKTAGTMMKTTMPMYRVVRVAAWRAGRRAR